MPTDENFGEVEFVQRPLNEDGTATFQRRDDGPYRSFVEKLVAAGPGMEGKVTVVTGAIRSQEVKQGKGRGQLEFAEAKAFQGAANDMGFGLKVSARHRTDGHTELRMMIQPKREFTPEQVANRILGQNKMRLGQYRQKLAKARALGDASAAAEAEAKIAELEAKVAPKPATPKAPANKGAGK